MDHILSRRFSPKFGLRFKSLTMSSSIILTIVAALSIYMITAQRDLLGNELQKRAVTLARNFAYNSEYPVLLQDVPSINQLASGVINEEDVVLVQVRSREGLVLVDQTSESIAYEEPTWKDYSLPRMYRTLSMSVKNGLLYVSVPIWKPSDESMFLTEKSTTGTTEGPVGAGIIGFSLKRTEKLIASSKRSTLMISLFIGGAGILVSFLAAHHFVKPLLTVAEGTREVASGNLSHRLDMVSRQDELGFLSSSFNEMAERLENSQKDLIAEIEERKHAEDALQEAHDKLELRVKERTEELVLINEKLRREVEERKTAEELLRASEERYRSFVYNFLGIAFKVTPAFEPIFFHGAVKKITGYIEDEFLAGRPRWDEIILPDDLPAFRDNMEKVGTNPDYATEIKYRIRRGDGHIRWIHQFVQNLCDESGSPIGIQGAIYDITEHKNLESQVQQKQKLEAIGTLAGGIAHDFNNILMTIVMNTEFALRNYEGGNSAREGLDLSLKAACRGRDLVEQILTFSRKSEEDLLPVTVSPIVKESLKMLRSSLPATIEIDQHIEAETGMVIISPGRIHQILINLCSNAAYAMAEGGGKLTVSLVEETFDSESDPRHPDIRDGSYLRLTVRDTGKGMPPDITEKIFDPFFTTKNTGEGTGMGLAVVHGIIEGIGGAIEVSSVPGKGTVFDIYLPRIERKETSSVEPLYATPGGSGKILVVDDEESVVESLKRVLTHLGYQIIGKTSSMQALEVFKQEPGRFDLVITDHIMPELTGLALAEEILSIQPDIPIILCTGYAEVISKDQAEIAGVRELVIKPIGMAELAGIVRRLLEV
ncbi:MAG: ATP-binding protein [Thermodesulfobacteriota bacterium]|nr:ATP-binding protein [Thermodesulfobacteriota bacterium]